MRSTGLSLALVSMVLLAPISGAQAAFAPESDPIAGAEQFKAAIGTDPDGASLVVWSQKQSLVSPYELKARRLDATGGLGPVFDLAPGEHGREPVVGMSASGSAFVAWRLDSSPADLRGRWVGSDGSLGPLLTLAIGDAGKVEPVEVHVVVDPAGVATVSWENDIPGTLSARRAQPDSTLGPVVLDISGGGGVTNHTTAALPNGDTVAVWRGTGIEKNVLTSGLGYGEPSTISAINTTSDPEIGVDSLGNGLVVWRESAGQTSVRGRRLGPTGAAVDEELIIDPDQAGFTGPQVRVSADSNSDFLVTWNRQNSEGQGIVYARGINSSAGFSGPAQPLSAAGASASAQQSTLEDHGAGATVWNSAIGESTTTLGRTINSLGVPSGDAIELFNDGFGDIEVSSAPAIGFAAFLIQYATSGSAQAAVVRRFLVPPACTSSEVTLEQAGPIRVPLSCRGAGIEGANVLSEPTHGTLGPIDVVAPSVVYTPKPGSGGNDNFSFSMTNDGGASQAAEVSIKDKIRPTITHFRFAALAAKKSKPPKRIYGFRLKFSEPAAARVVVERPRRGVRKGKRCVRRRKGIRGKPCTRYRQIGKLSSKTARQSITLAVRGKLLKRLRTGGRFRASAVATDQAGNRSKPPKRIRFTLKTRRRR